MAFSPKNLKIWVNSRNYSNGHLTAVHEGYKGAPQPLQEESGPSEMGTHSTVRDKFDALGVHCLFLLSFACNASGR